MTTRGWSQAESEALTARLAVADGHRVRLTMAERRAGIRLGARLIAAGRLTRAELARRLGMSMHNLRRVAKDIGVTLPLDPPEPCSWTYAYQRGKVNG